MERMVNAATSDSDAAKNAKQRYPLGTPVCERFAFGWYTGEVTGFEDGMYEVTCAALAEREVAAAPRSPAAGGGSKEQDRRGKAAFGPVRFHRRRGGGRSHQRTRRRRRNTRAPAAHEEHSAAILASPSSLSRSTGKPIYKRLDSHEDDFYSRESPESLGPSGPTRCTRSSTWAERIASMVVDSRRY